MYKEEVAQPTVSIENTVETKFMEESIVQYLRELKPEYRVLVEYRWRKGLSYREIADLLEVTEDAVKQRLYRARESIKKMLFKEWGVKDEKRKI